MHCILSSYSECEMNLLFRLYWCKKTNVGNLAIKILVKRDIFLNSQINRQFYSFNSSHYDNDLFIGVFASIL